MVLAYYVMRMSEKQEDIGGKKVSITVERLWAAVIFLVTIAAGATWFTAVYASKVDTHESRIFVLETDVEKVKEVVADVRAIKESLAELNENVKYLLRKQ